MNHKDVVKGGLYVVVSGNIEDPDCPPDSDDSHYFRMRAVVTPDPAALPDDDEDMFRCRAIDPQPLLVAPDEPFTDVRYNSDRDDWTDTLKARHLQPYIPDPLDTLEQVEAFLDG